MKALILPVVCIAAMLASRVDAQVLSTSPMKSADANCVAIPSMGRPLFSCTWTEEKILSNIKRFSECLPEDEMVRFHPEADSHGRFYPLSGCAPPIIPENFQYEAKIIDYYGHLLIRLDAWRVEKRKCSPPWWQRIRMFFGFSQCTPTVFPQRRAVFPQEQQHR